MPQVRGLDDEQLDRIFARVESLVARILRRIARFVAARIGGGLPEAGLAAVSPDDLAPVVALWRRHLDAEVRPALAGVYRQTAEKVADQLAGFGHQIRRFDAQTAEEYLTQAGNRLAGIGDTTWESLRDQLADGVQAGDSIGELTARVRAASGVAEPRARTIARTECLAAHNAATLAQAMALGDPTVTKTWLATDDERTRPTHAVADGQRVKLGEAFHVGGSLLMFPGDPTAPSDEIVNCRCSVAVALDDEPSVASVGVFHLPGRHDQKDHGGDGGPDLVQLDRLGLAARIDLDEEGLRALADILKAMMGGGPDVASLTDLHLPGRHDQRTHGLRGRAGLRPRSRGTPAGDDLERRQRRVERVIGKARRTHATDITHGVDGAWDAERDRLHRDIAADLYAQAASVPTDGKAVIAGGIGGAGKSTVLREHADIDPSEYFTINPDDIKEELARRGLIPEVPDAPDLSPMERVALVHEESSRIAHLLADMAYRDRRNMVWDITMSSESAIQSRVAALKRHGYTDVVGVFVDIPVEVSVRRALTRYQRGVADWERGEGQGGRFVPPAVIRAQRTSGGRTINRDVFETMKEIFTDWAVYDNSVDGRAPQLIARRAAAAGTRREG